ncbi:MAG: EipA family protein [Pseudomonadota bacterium]
MHRIFIAALCAVSFGLTGAAVADSCTPSQFGKVVDDTGERLRQANAASEKDMRRKFLQLAKQKGWSKDAAVERGFELLTDNEVRTLDAQASELLIRLDQLGDADDASATCPRLSQLKEVSKQLLEVTAAKRAHISAKLNVALQPKLKSRPQNQKPKVATNDTQARPKPPSPRTNNAPPTPTKQSTNRAWSTNTVAAKVPPREVMAALPPVQNAPANYTYGSHEIRAVGQDLFGSTSAELASVLKFAFDSYGKPNGYVLGTEAGASFLAGLRYGHGQLVTKQFGQRKIYWQGPSVGTDFGITGSRVMVLVYNLKDPERIFSRFVGVEGAAYLVGGVGITFHKQGDLVLAPIRTGLGLRLGANIGYLKITPRRSLNPF